MSRKACVAPVLLAIASLIGCAPDNGPVDSGARASYPLVSEIVTNVSGTCADVSTWPNIRNDLTCDVCTAMINARENGGLCSTYCESFGHVCAAAYEERRDSCQVEYIGDCNTPILHTGDALCTCHLPTPDTTCDDVTKEFEVNMRFDSFANRSSFISNFRRILEDLEDNRFPDWFKHKGRTGRERFQKAEYLELAGNAFETRNLSFRFRRDISGAKENKTDFVVKFKSGNPSFAAKPMTAAAGWRDSWSCKMESNLKRYQCPHQTCYPGSACDTECPELGPPGVGLEFKEQAAKIKSNADEAFAATYRSAAQFTQLSNITSFFPDVAQYFNLAPQDAPLRTSRIQFRYVFDKVELELNGTEVDSALTLWYTSENDLMSNDAVPYMGTWSFKTEQGSASWDKEALAEQVIMALGEVV